MYIVSLSKFEQYAHTYGNTYEEALNNAQEVVEFLIEDYQAWGRVLSQPLTSKLPINLKHYYNQFKNIN